MMMTSALDKTNKFSLVPLIYCSQTHFNYLAYQYFDIERT